MIRRDIQNELQSLAKDFPVVTLTGPRQSGKTTLAKAAFPDHAYCNLEHPELRLLAETDPQAFFSQYSAPLIIDEIQRVPELLSYIQVRVDEDKSKGQYILTGSHQLSLAEGISQSLAGRTALLTLLPFSISELAREGITLSRDEYLFKGFLPAIYDQNLSPTRVYRNYLQTYVERDVRQILNIKNLNNFRRFIYLLAGRIGQPLNLHSISRDLGVSSKTLSEWLSVLEASFIVFTLQPYHDNFGKRIVKSPKVYFFDTGFLSYLLGYESGKHIGRDPLIGNIFENLVVVDFYKNQFNAGREANLFFYRDNNGNEVDLLLRKSNRLIPIEIKSAMTYHDSFLKGIKAFQRITNTDEKGIILYAGELSFSNESAELNHFSEVKSYI